LSIRLSQRQGTFERSQGASTVQLGQSNRIGQSSGRIPAALSLLFQDDLVGPPNAVIALLLGFGFSMLETSVAVPIRFWAFPSNLSSIIQMTSRKRTQEATETTKQKRAKLQSDREEALAKALPEIPFVSLLSRRQEKMLDKGDDG
jgi:hypothetical protein